MEAMLLLLLLYDGDLCGPGLIITLVGLSGGEKYAAAGDPAASLKWVKLRGDSDDALGDRLPRVVWGLIGVEEGA